jgi:hypothetical protein
VVYVASGQPVIEGLRLINGNATGLGGAWGDGGGGIYVNSGASPTIRNCTIANSTAYHGGGLFLVQNSATLEGNTIISNTAGLYGGGAISLYADGNTYTGNIIRANQSQDGAGLYLYGSDVRLINNLIADNFARWDGGGVYVRNAAPQFWHNTIARNLSQWDDSSGLYLQSSTSTLVNTILTGHDIGVYADVSSTATLTATLWSNALDTGGDGSISIGTANFHGDPAFVSAITGDYHLTQTSDAIDQGAPSDVETDLDNQARPNGSVSDLGADEWYKRANQAPLTPTNPSPINGELNVWVWRTLSWQSSDPDGDPITYTSALGPSDPPEVVGQTNSLSFDPGQLLTNTHYYWKVTATDGVSVTVGPLWEFTTRSDAIIYRVYLPLVLK